MAETAAERKARIRKRLKEADTPQAEVTRNVVAEPKKEEAATNENTPEPVDKGSDDPLSTGSKPNRPSNRSIANRVTQQRNSKPANYKIHVITALGLAVAIRVAALGAKAVVGGK